MTAGNPYAVKSLTSMEDLSTEDLEELAGPEELAEELRRLHGEELGLVRHTLRAIRKSRIKRRTPRKGCGGAGIEDVSGSA